MRNRKDEPDIPRGNSSDIKPKIIELDRKIGHKSFMSIFKFFIVRDEPAHLVDQAIHDMEGIGDASSEGANGMYQLFSANFFGLWSRHALSVSIYAFSSWIGMWNRLVTPPIDYRVGMEVGGEGESSKEANGGM